jgi:S-adenosylhomocysteine hydrolase
MQIYATSNELNGNINKYYSAYYCVDFSSRRFAKITLLGIKIAIESVNHIRFFSAGLMGFKVLKIGRGDKFQDSTLTTEPTGAVIVNHPIKNIQNQ